MSGEVGGMTSAGDTDDVSSGGWMVVAAWDGAGVSSGMGADTGVWDGANGKGEDGGKGKVCVLVVLLTAMKGSGGGADPVSMGLRLGAAVVSMGLRLGAAANTCSAALVGKGAVCVQGN